MNKAKEHASGTYVEGLGNVLSIKSAGAQKNFSELISEKEKTQKDREYERQAASTLMWQTFQVFNAFAYGVFLFMAGFDVIAGVITVGSIVIFYGYIAQLIGGATQILSTYSRLIQAKSGIARMMDILWADDARVDGTKTFPQTWDALTFRDIEFHYNQDNGDDTIPDLHALTLTIPQASKIGIVGKTGCGKSTFTKLLMGLYPQSSGDYYIGDVTFSDIQHDEVGKHMSIVLQESEMFNLSLKENITLMRDVSDELLEKAIAIAHLSEVIEKLPDGLDTQIGEKGYHLSGGERQRIGIARAICREPQILIFDEATSALDSRTEKAIQRAIEEGLNDATLIFIAHRITTLENVDTIYVF